MTASRAIAAPETGLSRKAQAELTRQTTERLRQELAGKGEAQG